MRKSQIEVWKAIKGYEGLYVVSNLGRVKSVERVVMRKNGKPQTIKEKILKQYERNDDYLQVTLWKNGVGEPKLIHILVATAFIPNPNNYTVVHHKNHDKKDNRVVNLEWMDEGEHFALHTAEKAEKFGKRADQIDKVTGEVLRQWKRLNDVGRELGYSISLISHCCNGGFYDKSRGKWRKAESAYNYVWKYPILE